MKLFYMHAAALALTLAPAVYAVETAPKPEAFTCDTKAIVRVQAMACDGCMRSLEKLFGKRSEITEMDVDMSTSTIIVYSGPGLTLPDEELANIITDAGYPVLSIIHEDC